jgi:hypothetical protein
VHSVVIERFAMVGSDLILNIYGTI